MIVGVVGLGLIGGSMAKAINQNTGNSVYGYDINTGICKKAVLVGAAEGVLTKDILRECDVVILGLYPDAVIDFVKSNLQNFKKDCIVMDTCGIKDYVCRPMFDLAEKNEFNFIGAHPMAGVEHMGFEYSKKALFDGASLILVPPRGMSISIVDRISKLMKSAGFSETPVVDAKTHDRIIAYTSQLAHVVSSAYIMSDTAFEHSGFSAGSYKDMTRVAKLNEDMWTELFLENREFLANEIDDFVNRLKKYSESIRKGDEKNLHKMLADGRKRKLAIDKEIF